jgi:hypothetical protein
VGEKSWKRSEHDAASEAHLGEHQQATRRSGQNASAFALLASGATVVHGSKANSVIELRRGAAYLGFTQNGAVGLSFDLKGLHPFGQPIPAAYPALGTPAARCRRGLRPGFPRC